MNFKSIKVLSLLTFLLFVFDESKGQGSIDRWVIGSLGGSSTVGSYNVMYSVGEAVVSSINYNGGTDWLTQGFEQADDSLPDGKSGHFYNGFTPNGDGYNDYWHIDSIGFFKNVVEIYNRWGNKVWEAVDYDNSTIFWDGLNTKGEALPSATYFFYIRMDALPGGIGGLKVFKGWVELTR